MFADQGLLLGFLNREMVLKAFNGWLLDKSLPLGEILVNQKSITFEERQQIEQEQDEQTVSSDPNHCPLDTTRTVLFLASDCKLSEDPDLLDWVSETVLLQPMWNQTTSIDMEGLSETALPSTYIVSEPEKRGTTETVNSLDHRFDQRAFLDSGSLGVVYSARDKELNRTVVLKFLKSKYANNPLNRALFRLEGEVTGYLEHPIIPPVYGMYLEKTFKLNKAANQGRENPSDLVFLAMVSFELKRTKDAEDYFQRLKVAMKNEVFAKDKDSLAFFAKADQMLHAK